MIDQGAQGASVAPLPGEHVPAFLRPSACAAFLLVILICSALIRLYSLDSNPPGFFRDEAAIAINASSIATTGTSLSGSTFPLYFEGRSSESWGAKGTIYQPIYTYASVPAMSVLGVSPVSARVTSVAFGLVGIIFAYLLVSRLFDRKAALIAAALIAISPWHLHFSRIAFEAISMPALLSAGAYFLVRGTSQPRLLPLGSSLSALAIYSYPTAKVFVPVLLVGFAIIYRRALLTHLRMSLVAASLVILIGIPDLYLMVADVHQDRAHALLIFSADLKSEYAVRFLSEWAPNSPLAAFIFDHEPIRTAFGLVYNYLSYLGPGFLFMSGDPNLRHSPEGWGMLYVFLIPLLIAGLVVLFRRRKEAPVRFISFWLFAFPLPASLTVDSPHAIRALTSFPVFEIIASLGALGIYEAVRSHFKNHSPSFWRSALGFVAAFFVVIRAPMDVFGYFHHYHTEYPVYASKAWQGGVGKAVQVVESLKGEYERVLVSSRIRNSYLYIVMHAGVDLGSIKHEDSLNEQLRPYKYRIMWEPIGTQVTETDLLLVTAEEMERYSMFRTIAAVEHPDGSPTLVILEGKSSVLGK